MYLFLLVACTGPSSSADDTGSDGPPATLHANRACLVPADGVPEDYTQRSYIIQAFGRVVDSGQGPPAGGCRDRDDWVGNMPGPDWTGENSWWVEIETADTNHWFAAATNPWIPDPSLLKKQEVTVSYRSLLGDPASRTAGQTEMLFEGPDYRFYLGSAGDLSDLEPPEDLSFSKGAVEVELDDDCGHHVRHFLDAAGEDGSASVTTGDTHGFGTLAVWSGGIIDNPDSDCAELPASTADLFEWETE